MQRLTARLTFNLIDPELDGEGVEVKIQTWLRQVQAYCRQTSRSRLKSPV